MRDFDASRVPPPAGYEDFRLPREGFSARVLEIGAGVGWHALSYARAHPDHFVMAVEHSSERFAKFEGRLRAFEAELGGRASNLIAVHADAESFVVHAIPEASLDGVFILYPNPYPKASQANKRWHRMPFMRFLIERLKPGTGTLEFATNEDFYAGEFHEAMHEVWGMRQLCHERVSRDADPDFRPRTHFEKKYYLRGEMLHLMRFARPY